jgi:hypothetical protein
MQKMWRGATTISSHLSHPIILIAKLKRMIVAINRTDKKWNNKRIQNGPGQTALEAKM